MAECNTSSYEYNSTPIKATSNGVLWVGGDIKCNGETLVCNNTRLTELQLYFADKICDLIGLTDMSSVKSFTCSGELGAAFQSLLTTTDNDPTILELVNFLLTQQCITNTNLSNIATGATQIENFDPVIEDIDYPCCDDTCIGGTTLKLSEHIQKIILCLCETRSYTGIGTNAEITNLTAEIEDLKTLTSHLNDQINGALGLNYVVTGHTNQIADLYDCTDCLQ